MNDRLNIFCDFSHDPAAIELLQREASSYNLILKSDATPNWNEIDIAIGQPDLEGVLYSERLKWIHVSSAGYTRYDSDEVRDALKRRGAILTNSSSVFDEPCAQHLLAMMLATARGLPECVQEQSRHLWDAGRRRSHPFLPNGQQVLLLGFGAIAKRLVALLKPFEMNIAAVRRHPQPFEGVEVAGESELEVLLARADHVVSTLPDAPSTRKYLEASRFAAMKPGAYFYNVGRGTTVDQDALLQVLASGHLSGAYLDVTEPEPLPSEHALWSAPNCFITPHIAGGHRDEASAVMRHFVANLRRFEAGAELADRVF